MHGAFFIAEDAEDDERRAEADRELRATSSARRSPTVQPGEGLVGQAALERKSILITQAPEDYITIASGLGEAAPLNIVVLPVLFEEQVMAVDRARLVRALQRDRTRPSSSS